MSGYATVGVTWKHGTKYADDQIDVTVRTEKDGTWSRWTEAAYHDEHGPDGGSTEENAGRERPGTDALVVGDVDRVQMRAETTDGTTPPDLKLAVIDPGTGAMTKEAAGIDTAKLDSPQPTGTSSARGPQALSVPDTGSDAGSEVQDTVALSAMKTAPRPKIYTRVAVGRQRATARAGVAPTTGRSRRDSSTTR